MTLREDWKNFKKFISIWGVALATSLQIAWPLIPQDLKSSVPSWFLTDFTLAFLGLTVFGIMTKQNFSDKSTDNNDTTTTD